MQGCEPRNFLQPCLLLLLTEQPAHGYDLLDRLKPFGVADGDPGSVYRCLRSLERAGFVRSAWSPSDTGPARRTYHTTTEGLQELQRWRGLLRETRNSLDYYLFRYTALATGQGPDPPAAPGAPASYGRGRPDADRE
ncbi:MAG: helix-turn-helix transcriptional regulator [Carbonactinosporaceae bacterium]